MKYAVLASLMLIMPSRGPSEVLLSSSELRVTERGLHHRILERVVERQTAGGQTIRESRRIYELGTGMHRLVNGAYVECNNRLELFNGAAVARETSFPIIFSASPNVAGAVDCEAPDQKSFRYTVLGLSIFDEATGLSLLIAEVQDTIGELHPPDRVFYPRALVGTLPQFGTFDLFYSVYIYGWEQNVLIRSKIELPAGFNPETSRLECWTEVVDGPEPQKHVRTVNNMKDENLYFGATSIGPGKAFVLDGPGAETWSTPVAKTWVQDPTGRRFIVEAVPWKAIQPYLDQLPAPGGQAAVRPNMGVAKVSKERVIPAQRPTRKASEPMRMAAAPMPDIGLVLDFSQLLSGSNVRLEGDKTYLCSSLVLLTNLIIEGGCVVKFTNSASIELAMDSSILCLTSPYRPAVFTSVFDSTVGESIVSGTPNREIGIALSLQEVVDSSLSYLRISYAKTGIKSTTVPLMLTHCIFTYCSNALNLATHAYVRNTLMYDIDKVVAGDGPDYVSLTGEHITFNECDTVSAGTAVNTFYLTNCLAVNLGSWGNGTFYTNAVVTNGSQSTFKTVGSSRHYLADNSPYRNAGATGTAIASEIKTKTTFPPIVFLAGTNLTNLSLTLGPQAQRDDDGRPDLGWHPDPLDFVFNTAYVTNATITVQPGTAIGVYTKTSGDYGILLHQGAKMICDTSAPTNLARIVRISTVQELSTNTWTGAFGPSLNVSFDGSPKPELKFRFTDFSMLARETEHIYASGGAGGTPAIEMVDAQIRGGKLLSNDPVLSFTNCLFDRVYTTLIYSGAETNFFQNNLFYGGEVYAAILGTNAGVFRDNLFDKTILSNSTAVANSYNGYLTNENRLTPSGPTDAILISLTYETGPLSRFYLPTNSPLIDVGSVNNAALKGMYWHSSFANGTWEGNSPLNIGLMFIAVTNGVAVDADGEGLSSYLEDKNGNGTRDAAETAFLNPATDQDSDGDGVSDYIEFLQGRNPLTNAVNDVNGIINLKVFTPLK